MLDQHSGNLTNSTDLPPVVIPNYTISSRSGVNLMMDYSQEGTGLNEQKHSNHGSGVEFEAHADDKCQPKYFVFNSQAGLYYNTAKKHHIVFGFF